MSGNEGMDGMLQQMTEESRSLQAKVDEAKAVADAEGKKQESAKQNIEALKQELKQLYNDLSQRQAGTSAPDGDSDYERVRSLSDADVAAAEIELDQIVSKIEQDCASISKTGSNGRIFLLALGIILLIIFSPGILLSLKEAGFVEIKKGTALSDLMFQWESKYFQVKGQVDTAFMLLANLTACAMVPPPPTPPPYQFTAYHPPLMKDGYSKDSESSEILWGEAALHVCAIGTSEQSFLRRDDCDGCLCQTGSVWIHYKDPRFFGEGKFCVPSNEWKTCISDWACCRHKPNFCWEFIWNGGRQDPEKDTYKVVVDSCALHGGCYVMIERYRQWVLIKDFKPSADQAVEERWTVGLQGKDIAAMNQTLNIGPELRGWGLPSSAQYLLKLGPHSAPAEWQPEKEEVRTVRYPKGKRQRIWQLYSRYVIKAKDMHGDAHVLIESSQKEWKTYTESE